MAARKYKFINIHQRTKTSLTVQSFFLCISLSISIRELKLLARAKDVFQSISLSISIRELKLMEQEEKRLSGISLSISIRELKHITGGIGGGLV